MQELVMARVVALAGRPYAYNTMGELRELGVGEAVLEGETVLTPEDSRVELQLSNGSTLRLKESSQREIGRDLLLGLEQMAAALPAIGPPGFCKIADGSAVQNAAGRNLFYNEKPLYWSLNRERSCASAIAHVSSGSGFVDHTAFEIRLEKEGECAISVGAGVFLVETHNVPFTTGDPEPGRPTRFFGVSGDSEGFEQGELGDGRVAVTAEVQSLSVCNNWFRDGEDIVFEFPAASGDLVDDAQAASAVAGGRRAINNFTFQNTGQGPATFIARAYRGTDYDPVYQVGSQSAPMRIAAGEVFGVISQHNYDRLVLTPVESCDSCSKISLSLEGFSEFACGDVAMNVLVAKGDSRGQFRFVIDQHADQRADFRCEMEDAPDQLIVDSIWERLSVGLASGPVGE